MSFRESGSSDEEPGHLFEFGPPAPGPYPVQIAKQTREEQRKAYSARRRDAAARDTRKRRILMRDPRIVALEPPIDRRLPVTDSIPDAHRIDEIGYGLGRTIPPLVAFLLTRSFRSTLDYILENGLDLPIAGNPYEYDPAHLTTVMEHQACAVHVWIRSVTDRIELVERVRYRPLSGDFPVTRLGADDDDGDPTDSMIEELGRARASEQALLEWWDGPARLMIGEQLDRIRHMAAQRGLGHVATKVSPPLTVDHRSFAVNQGWASDPKRDGWCYLYAVNHAMGWRLLAQDRLRDEALALEAVLTEITGKDHSHRHVHVGEGDVVSGLAMRYALRGVGYDLHRSFSIDPLSLPFIDKGRFVVIVAGRGVVGDLYGLLLFLGDNSPHAIAVNCDKKYVIDSWNHEAQRLTLKTLLANTSGKPGYPLSTISELESITELDPD
jgi:hypothetical protein